MLTQRVFGLGAALCLAAYFILLAGTGLFAGFNHDDLMNMYRAEVLSTWGHVRDIALFFTFSETHRPLGSLYYRLLYHEFGFHPLAYRVGCFVLMGLNGALAYALARELSNSSRIALVTVLLFAFHGEMSPLYFSTGFIYDLLCFTFYCGAFLFYLRAREGGGVPGRGAMLAWTALFILCLNSKEMAVTLPVMIGLWEAMGPRPRDWRVAVWGGVLVALFVAGRLTGPTALSANAEYTTDLRAAVYLDRAQNFLWFVAYRAKWFTAYHAAAIAAGGCLAAVFWRVASLRWALLWMGISILPIAFISQRSLAAAYIPFLALAFLLAHIVCGAFERLPYSRGQWQFAVLWLGLLALLFHVHRKHNPMPIHLRAGEHVHIAAVASQLAAWRQELRCAQRILIVRDPFPRFEWNSYFLISLLAMEPHATPPACAGVAPSLTSPDRVLIPKRLKERYAPDDAVPFDLVLTYESGAIAECDAEPFGRSTVGQLGRIGCRPPKVRATTSAGSRE